MPKVREIVAVEAIQYTGNNIDELFAFGVSVLPLSFESKTITMNTSEGRQFVAVGFWIVKFNNGRVSAMSNELFRDCYDLEPEPPVADHS